jgi:hypothetical protein
MLLAALVDAGVPLAEIQDGIDSLGMAGCQLQAEVVKRRGFRATKIHVQHPPDTAHRRLHTIVEMIERSRLTARQKDIARRTFERLGAAEAYVHGTTVEKIHFHEVGAVDSITDIVGSAIGCDLLGVEQFVVSPIPTGQGTIEMAHGRTSVPAPATAELLKGIPLAESNVICELTTPTGAALVSTLASRFGPLPAMSIERIGYGAGDRDLETQPNILRLLVGQQVDGPDADHVWTLETNIDDTSGEVLAYCTERLLAEGALDVFTTPIQMKKNRPAVKLTVLCDDAHRGPLERIIFQETTTLGIRRWMTERTKLLRSEHTVQTPWGSVSGKLARLPDGTPRFAPEFDQCRDIARRHHLAVQQVMEAAREAFGAAHESGLSTPANT